MATLDGAARRLKCSTRTVRRYLDEGKLEPGEDGEAVSDGSLALLSLNRENEPDESSDKAQATLAAAFADTTRALTRPLEMDLDHLQRLLDRSTARIDALELRIAAGFDERESLASRAAEREDERLASEQARKLKQKAVDVAVETVQRFAEEFSIGRRLEPARKWAMEFKADEWAEVLAQAPDALKNTLAMLRPEGIENGKTQPRTDSEAIHSEPCEGRESEGDAEKAP